MPAVISDIHSNIEALDAVLQHISSQGIDEIWCLGDIVGYGPNPGKCIDLIEKNCSVTLMGNHDWAVLHAPDGFNSMATQMIYKTKQWLRVDEDSKDEEIRRWEFLENLDVRAEQNDFLLVHASPRAELSEYLLPSDVTFAPDKFRGSFANTSQYFLGGHSHLPCCVTEDFELNQPEVSGYHISLDERKTYINIGSVGQPRDGDPRACYAILDQGRVTWHRVPYHYERTARKLRDLGVSYDALANRLAVGR
ncbi:MAG: metallophosphoesterase family protein [Planctomycetota bacterium]